MRNRLSWLAALAILCLVACHKDDVEFMDDSSQRTVTVPAAQQADSVASYAQPPITGGIRLHFQMSGITHLELESVDGYALAGTATVTTREGQPVVVDVTQKQSIIVFSAPAGETLSTEVDHIITTFPCDVYGGYRLSIYKDGKVAHYFGVHQRIVSDEFIMPLDLDESELDFVNPDDPFVEDERPELNQATRDALARYRNNPTEESKNALLEQMGIRYDKVVARKKAKLRQLERDAHDPSLVDEMQAIVDEMVENREVRLFQQFLRLIDPREDEDPDDSWMVLRGSSDNNAYIGYAPVTNAEYAAYKTDYTFPAGQERWPVVDISYNEAVAYCHWLSMHDDAHDYRLPTEEEWIMAAGHMPKDMAMNSNHVESGLTSVDAYAQSTGACGGIDFWGNCWEWTSTQNAQGQYIVKGGSWDSSRDACRSEWSDDVRDGTVGYPNVGMRVVREDR